MVDHSAVRLIGIVGPTAAGKSALGVRLAEAVGGEIISCDSTAVYRGIDIGTDKPSAEERRGIPHHLIDVAGPTEIYTAARYGADAALVVREIVRRRRVPILVGGTGFYYRALTRGLFPGPGRDEALRARLERVAARRGVPALHRWVSRVDPDSGRRILPGDQKRLVRALEVYLLTGRPLTAQFEDTVSPLGAVDVCLISVALDRAQLESRVTTRVEAQLSRGVVEEVQSLVDSGVPETAHALSGLVYRQVLEYLRGDRDLAATRALIVRENMRYAKRQVSWFRREPGIQWVSGPGESDAAYGEALRLVRSFLARA